MKLAGIELDEGLMRELCAKLNEVARHYPAEHVVYAHYLELVTTLNEDVKRKKRKKLRDWLLKAM